MAVAVAAFTKEEAEVSQFMFLSLDIVDDKLSKTNEMYLGHLYGDQKFKDCIIPTSSYAVKQSNKVREEESQVSLKNRDKSSLKISLNDCLACNGCITSAETVLVNDQSLTRLLDGIAGRKMSVITISPQTVCSIAVKRSISVSDASRLIASFFLAKGVTYVVDSSFGRQLALRFAFEEFMASEKRPVLTSACPGFVCYAEKTYGNQLVPYISRVRSPQAIHGALVKDYLARTHGVPSSSIFHAAVMPCFDKKLEASRNDFLLPNTSLRETDCVISTAELELELHENVDDNLRNLPEGWLGDFGRGNLIGTPETSSSGGYADFVVNKFLAGNSTLPIRTFQQTKNLTVTEIGLPDCVKLRVARLYGFKNIQNFVRKLKSGSCHYDYIEIMACPGGCGNGGGQIRSATTDARESALKSVETLYKNLSFHRLQEMDRLIEEWEYHNMGWRNMIFTDYHIISTNVRQSLQW